MTVRVLAALSAAIMPLAASASAPTVESTVARARQLAGSDFGSSLFLCDPTIKHVMELMVTQTAQQQPPTKAFDNLWYVGNGFIGVWVLDTGAGLILFDSGIGEADVRQNIEPGLRSLGLDPAKIRYAIVTHAHWDHFGGAKYLQETYGTRIALSEADWDILDGSKPGDGFRVASIPNDGKDRPPPRRDIVITDGQKLELGDSVVTLLVTPGHTRGTVSALVPVREGGRRVVLSLLGGTAFPPALEPFDTWGGLRNFRQSVQRLAAASREAGAVGLLNTHIFAEGSDARLVRARARKPGDPNPFILGADKVQRYYELFETCLDAATLRQQDAKAVKSANDTIEAYSH